MKLWPILLGGIAGLAMFLSHSSRCEIKGLENLLFPAVLRADDGCFHFIEDGSQFLNHFELQDLSDDSYQGWDARGRSFRFLESGHGSSLYLEVGQSDYAALERSLDQFYEQAAALPGWASSEDCQMVRDWFGLLQE